MELLGNEIFLRESPWAKTYISERQDGGFWAEFREKMLWPKVKEGNALSAMTIPVLPFDSISQKDLREVFLQSERGAAALVCGAIRSRAFADALEPVGVGCETDIARLFSEHTSGRQLDKFAELHPDLAILAACHPNGGDVSLNRLSSQMRDKAESLRPTQMLPGRSCVAVETTESALVL